MIRRREPRTEVVSVRLTKAERKRLDELGGPTSALRRALEPAPQFVVREVRGVGIGTSCIIWDDGTVGPNWPSMY